MKRLVYAGLFVAFGLLLPMLFHALGMAGAVFSPMHIPVLPAGLGLGPALGAAVGLLTPLLSFILTGMPPASPPILPLMMVEPAVYGLVAGVLVLQTGRERHSVWLSLIGAMAAGRIALGFAAVVAVRLFGWEADPLAYVLGSLVTGLPGIVPHLLLLPALYRLLRLLPSDLAPAPGRISS